jgi:hypothetical protein
MASPVPFEAIYQPTHLFRKGVRQHPPSFAYESRTQRSLLAAQIETFRPISLVDLLALEEDGIIFAGPGWGKTTFMSSVFRTIMRSDEELVAGAALDAKKRGILPTYWGATVTSLRQEPTWGDTDVLQKILPRLQPANAAKLVAAFSSVHSRAKAIQLIRNGAAHSHSENMADILQMQSAYVAFRISHPVQALYWVEPLSGDFLITHALDALKDAALVAIS